MRFKFAVETDNEADLVAMQRAMRVLGEGTITAQSASQIAQGGLTQSGLKMAQLPQGWPSRSETATKEPQNTEANGEEPAAPKRRGRPPGYSPKRAKAEEAARTAESTPEPEPEPAPAWASELADETVLKTVTDFVKQNRPLSGQVGNLLRQYECERVTQLPVERRSEFLSELRNLAALQ